MILNLNNQKKLFFFLIAGLPSFILAIFLNLYLVEVVEIDSIISYGIILIIQVIINFFINLKFVFNDNNSKSQLAKFVYFLILILIIRSMDWFFFVLLVKYFEIWYLFAQIISVLTFGLVKFYISKKIFE